MSKNTQSNSKHYTNAALFRAKRLIQIFYAAEIAFSVGIVVQLLEGSFISATILLVSGMIIYPVKALAKNGKVTQGGTLLLVIITLMVSLLILRYEGVKDVALLTYPGILIFSVMIGGGKLFRVLLTLMVAVILIVVVNNISGFYVNSSNVNIGYDAALILLILLTTAYSIWLWSNDLQLLFKKLEIENTKSKQSQKQIEYIAQHDALTNLPNRLLSKLRFEQDWLGAIRSRTSIALLYIDLDNFKEINDTLGHSAGDEFLKVISARLKRVVREVDTVSRQGGDEFLIIVKDIKDNRDIIAIAEKTIASVVRPVSLSNTLFECSGSVGISIYPDDGRDYETLLKKADLAMFHAKDKGKNNFQFYDKKLKKNLLKHLELVSELKVALCQKQFELYYQAKICLRSNSIIGAEALLRWNHPERGLIPPNDFIPAAEKSGLIIDIGRWVISKACRQCKQWQEKGFENTTVAVNVSPIQFAQDDIALLVSKILEKTKLKGNQLELEITESLLLNESEALNKTFNNIKQLGVKTSIDDFGTGYSNLKYLKHFDTSFIKIDQSFIRNMLDSNEDQAIVSAITQMAHSLNIEVIAEGVETKQAMNKLIDLGCDFAQGYYWAKPLPVEKFYKLLIDYRDQ